MNGRCGVIAVFLLALAFEISNALSDGLRHGISEWIKVRKSHTGRGLSEADLRELVTMGDEKHFTDMLDAILIPRVPDTPGNTKVRQHIVRELTDLEWHVEEDQFYADTPYKAGLSFTNIIATLDPLAPRRLVLACHYDTLNTTSGRFVGATDSAVPCAQLLNLAHVMRSHLNASKQQRGEVTLQLIFFDGEEAFRRWSRTDSTYGARHLAAKLEAEPYLETGATGVKNLHRIDLFVLLDLIGEANPTFYSFYRESEDWYTRLASFELRLRNENLYNGRKAMFQRTSWYNPGIEDDHVPFLERGVPILHLIPHPFPRVWHKETDDKSNIHMPTVSNFNTLMRALVADYLNINVL